MPTPMIHVAKCAAALCSLLALPLVAVLLILLCYAAADAIRTFGAPAVGVLLALVLAAELLWKRYARAGEAA